MKSSPKSKPLFYLYILLIFLPCLELALRILQYQPYQYIPFSIQSTPEFCILPDPVLGFSLRPGTFDVKINQAEKYTVTHGKDSLRITSYASNTDSPSAILLMGCSYTYGMGVDDSMTFPFLIQQGIPSYKVKNMGVPGYGTVQSYLQLKRYIQRGIIPEKVIVNYADFHDDRNALTPTYRKDLQIGFERANERLSALMLPGKVPYLAPDADGSFKIAWCEWGQMHRNWRGREDFSTVHFLQGLSERFTQFQMNPEAMTLASFQMIQEICKANEIELLVTGLTQTKATRRMLESLNENGMKTLDISVDLKNKAFHNFPHDSHPNTFAHRHFADELLRYICEEEE